MSCLKVSAWTLVTLLSVVGSLSARDACDDVARSLNITKDQLGDGITYVQVGSEWRSLWTLSDIDLPGPRTLSGVHVVHVTGLERNGLIIVKTGRVGPVESRTARNVQLVRRVDSKCKRGLAAPLSISGEAYDGYHDFGRSNVASSEVEKLNLFHTKFGADCSQSSNNDPGGIWRHYSNLSQFSFIEDVVDYGGYTGAEAFVGKFGIGRAVAAKERPIGKIERQTEIIPYDTVVGFACIPVSIPYRDKGSFFRTNDLGYSFQNGAREVRYWRRDNQ
jgi:hypothetical protein